MAKHRTVQHRPTEKSKNKELAELKKENHNLRRRVSKLQKYLQKALETSGGPREPEAQPENLVQEPTSGCPACGSQQITSLQLPTGSTLRGCRACGWKKKS